MRLFVVIFTHSVATQWGLKLKMSIDRLLANLNSASVQFDKWTFHSPWMPFDEKNLLEQQSPHTEIHDRNDDRKTQRISECGEEKMCRLGYKQEIWCAVQKINWYPGGEILTSKLFSRDSIFGLVFDRIYRTTCNLIRIICTFF